MARRDIWAYDPDICDGDFCPMNCDYCPKTDKVLEKQAEEFEPGDADLEMGFDPYLGCYTDDC